MAAELAQLCSDAAGLQAWLSQAMTLQVSNTSPVCTVFLGMAVRLRQLPFGSVRNRRPVTTVHFRCCMTVQCPACTSLQLLCCRLGRCLRPLQHALLAQPPQQPRRWAASLDAVQLRLGSIALQLHHCITMQTGQSAWCACRLPLHPQGLLLHRRTRSRCLCFRN